jgi:hypothetical protein
MVWGFLLNYYYYITYKYSIQEVFDKMAFFPQQNIGIPSPTSVNFTGSNTVFDLLDPSKARNAISGLIPGGISSLGKSIPNIGFQSMAGGGNATAASEDDWRVRVSLSPNAKIFYQDITQGPNALQHPLIETNGVIWPYTPQITVSHNANYSIAQLTHSNYPAHFYNNSEVADIQISGEFTVQNMEDGQYLMAAVYFLRSATKMFFGQGANAGNPPPMVFLDGYGSHYFPHVPCVVTQFSHTLPSEVDYIQVPISQTVLDTSPTDPNRSVNLTPDEQKYVPSLLVSNTQATTPSTKATVQNSRTKNITTTTRVPTTSTVSVTLRPVYSRKNIHERFDLEKFANGGLLADNDNGFGGFI